LFFVFGEWMLNWPARTKTSGTQAICSPGHVTVDAQKRLKLGLSCVPVTLTWNVIRTTHPHCPFHYIS
jgi:hypothetical protein